MHLKRYDSKLDSIKYDIKPNINCFGNIDYRYPLFPEKVDDRTTYYRSHNWYYTVPQDFEHCRVKTKPHPRLLEVDLKLKEAKISTYMHDYGLKTKQEDMLVLYPKGSQATDKRCVQERLTRGSPTTDPFRISETRKCFKYFEWKPASIHKKMCLPP
ncbi:unnamed protein product [Phyllotreta striolata]|uniref:Uncharacterized protein n=1 Tax=Phyllotreta striolata TaxID=444603 RepID=A0A9N9TIX0_PHYSR|nr:unnamed protein product [Phyllotreta striolata]